MSDDLANRLLRPWDTDRSIMSQTAAWMTERQQAAERISNLDAKLATARARIRELEAELAALREARGVRVKPLVWVHRVDIPYLHEALGADGWYRSIRESSGRFLLEADPLGDKNERPFSTIKAAKSAAQADYERRILAALEQAPVTPAEEARERIAIAIYGAECKADLYPECCPNWSDFPDHQWKWYAKADAALRALADAVDAGNV